MADGDYSSGVDSDGSLKISKYNSGWIQIMRLDELWKDAHKHSRGGKYMEWNHDLDRVWCELAVPLEDSSIDEYKKFEVELSKILLTSRKSLINIHLNQNTIYTLLMDKELFLRRLQDKLGKGSAYHENDEDYMDG